MANLTIAIDDALLKRARMRAFEQGTSVNALLRDYLIAFADTDRAMAARRAVAESSLRATSGSGPDGRGWTRDELYDRSQG